MNLKLKNEEYINIIEKNLKQYVKPQYPEIIYQAMEYSLLAGGKRIRPVILLAVCEALSGSYQKAIPFACALEMIHTYSLIHDDLPAMDNDDYRRGKLTCHKKFDEAIAILAGDGLLNMAYEIMSDCVLKNNDLHSIKAMNEICIAAGTKGMVGGQVVDIITENTVIGEDVLDYIHKNKTGKLLTAPFVAGAILADADEKTIEVLRNVGQKLGLAFQIQDDILDVTSTTEQLGKPVFSDEKNNKTTFVTLYGIDKSKQMYENLYDEIIKTLEKFENNKFLIEYIKVLTDRKK